MHVVTVTIFSLITCVLANLEDDIFANDANDPKDNYFRYVRTYTQADYDLATRESDADANNVPKPYGFRIYYPANTRARARRDLDDLANIDDESKPLELDVLEADNATNTTEATATATGIIDSDLDLDNDEKNDLVINDFIRFKRQVETMTNENAETRPKRERNGKMLLSPGETLLEGSREPRGAVKDQWLKQPYQVQTSDPGRNYDDNAPQTNGGRGGGGDLPPAPRVHFVTQRRSESAPPLVYHSYEREGRSRDLNRQRDMDLERDFEPAAYYPRPPRHYNPQSPLDRRPDMFYRDDERDIRERDHYRARIPQYQTPDRYYDEDRPMQKQKRIIYYATLPDIVQRTPAAATMDRERFNYRDDRHSSSGSGSNGERDNRFTPEDRYASQPISIGSGAVNYRFRNEAPQYDNSKSRYDEADAKTAAYPTKVSSPDVNVRALKKNPERRIYTEVDRRYPYKTPNYNHHDDGQFDRNHR